MSTVTLTPLITDVRNRMGNIVYSRWKETNYARRYSDHPRGNSEKQLAVRNAFSVAVSVWKSMGKVHHSSWNAFAQNLNMSGYNAFIKANVPVILKGTAMELFKSTGREGLASLSAGAGPSAGEIICAFSLPSEAVSGHVIFFVQKTADGKGTGSVSRYDAGADPSSPFVITGLVQGEEYFVYSITADSDYASAVAVSAALSIRTTAGA